MAQPPASPALTMLYDTVVTRVRGPIVAELQKVCRIENLQVSGKKAELQERIRAKATEYYNHRLEDSLRLLDERLRNPHSANFAAPRPQFTFKPSPFYKCERRLGQLVLPLSKEHRNTSHLTFTLSQEDVIALQAPNSTSRILLYASAKSAKDTPYQLLDLQFPTQMEIRVNDNEVKANTRGMKNKPGTTKPVDITSFTRRKLDVVNKLTITYALTQTLYNVYIWLSNKQSIAELKAEVAKRIIPKNRTLADLSAKADDTDIITTSTIMKLKDPVSFMRIQIPCRGSSCEHLGCFDLETYLSMQEQAPQWECPLCSKKAPFSDLAVDEYVQEILQKTSSSDESVTIDLDGKWSREAKNSNKSSNGTSASAYQDDDDSDDLIEVSGPRPSISVKAERPNTPMSMVTPSVSGDAGNRGQKRPAEVIDLTLDDEDDQPAAKRASSNTNTRPSNSRQSYTTLQVNQPSKNNYPYTSVSPLQFTLSGNSNFRNGTASPSIRDQSPFNPPRATFRDAIYSSIPGAAPSASRNHHQKPSHNQNLSNNQSGNQNQNQNTSQGYHRQSWNSNNFMNDLDGYPYSGSGGGV